MSSKLIQFVFYLFINHDILFFRNIVVDSVKTGMGGKIGNKGCVSIHS